MKSALKLTSVLVMVLAITFAFVGVFYFAGNEIAYAAEEPVVYVCDGETPLTITIVDETTCTATYGDLTNTLNYVIDGSKLTLTNVEKGTTMSFTIGEGNKLTKIDNTIVEPAPASDITSEEVAEEVKGKISDYLNQFLTESLVVKIITWLIDIGAIGALVGIYLKYRKYRHTTLGDIEDIAKDKIGEALKEKFGEMDGDVVEKLKEYTAQAKEIQDKIDVLLKAFALSQDKSAEGKLAMLNLLQDKTEDKEVEEKIEEIKEEIVETQDAVNDIVDKVDGEYKDIF